MRLPEELYALGKSKKFNPRVYDTQYVLNVQNRARGILARRGAGTFGEIIPYAVAEDIRGYVVARGPIATVEIGAEGKILAKAGCRRMTLRRRSPATGTAGGYARLLAHSGKRRSPFRVPGLSARTARPRNGRARRYAPISGARRRLMRDCLDLSLRNQYAAGAPALAALFGGAVGPFDALRRYGQPGLAQGERRLGCLECPFPRR